MISSTHPPDSFNLRNSASRSSNNNINCFCNNSYNSNNNKQLNSSRFNNNNSFNCSSNNGPCWPILRLLTPIHWFCRINLSKEY